MIWIIIAILLVFYVCYMLSSINHHLSIISKAVGVKEEKRPIISDEEIERQLEEELRN